jgi:hypothetical protein
MVSLLGSEMSPVKRHSRVPSQHRVEVRVVAGLITIRVAIGRARRIWLDLHSDTGLMGFTGRYVAQLIAEIIDTHLSCVRNESGRRVYRMNRLKRKDERRTAWKS